MFNASHKQTGVGQAGTGPNSQSRFLALAGLAVIVGCSMQASAQVPSVVASSQTAIAPKLSAGRTVVDSCGNTYVNLANGGGVVQIAAGTGAVTVVTPNTNGYNNGSGLGINKAGTVLYFPTNAQWYSSQFSVSYIDNCVPGTPQVFADNINTLGDYYYGTADSIAVDAAGDVFFTVTSGTNGIIFEESAANVPSYVQKSWPNYITSLASDDAGDLFFTDGSANIYEIAAGYSSAATTFATGFKKPVGLSFDAAGNLFVADGGASLAYEIPNVSGTLSPADKFAVVASPLVRDMGIDSSDDLYIANYSGVFEEKFGSVLLPATPIGSTSAATAVNYVFNASTVPGAATVETGLAASTDFSVSANTCTSTTALAAGASCSVSLAYTPTAVGLQTASLTLSDASSNVLSTVTAAAIGQGSAVTVDPGTLTTLAGGFQKPQGAAVDSQGNLYVVDSTANTVTQFSPGSSTGTVLSTGTVALSQPSGVAVDAIGDVFISSTGNNTIVELPVVAGALSPANTVALPLSVSSPQGLAVDRGGNLYIADTGNGRLLYVPNGIQGLNTAAAVGYNNGLATPSAVTVDANGNIFVADTTNADITEFPAPLSQNEIKAIAGLTTPSALATDASGSLYVVDSGSNSVYRFPNTGGSFGEKTVIGGGIAVPFGIAIDAAGDLYVTDSVNGLAVELNRIQGELAFGAWNVGSTSTAFTATVNNSGNQTLTVQDPDYTATGNTAAGFSITSDTCTTVGTLASGAACSITATFTPPQLELNAQETLNLLTSDSLGSPSVLLQGTGAHITPTTLSLALTSPAPGTPLTVGIPVTFTATINVGSNTATPGGSMQFQVNGAIVATVSVNSTTASVTLPAGLPAGSGVVITANYTGDQLNYSGSSASITENVSALTTALALAVNTPFNNPLSANDNAANSQGPSIPLVATLGFSGDLIPGGTVTFYSATSGAPLVLGTAPVTAVTGGGFQATVTTTALRAGTTNVVENNSFLSNYSIYAVYSGDTNFYPSTAPSQAVTIVGPPIPPNDCGTTGYPPCPANTTGATFSLALSSNNVTIGSTASGEGTGQTTITVTSYGGWSGYLNFTCSNLPAYASCAPYPGAALVSASTPGDTITRTQITFFVHTNVQPIKTSNLLWWLAAPFGLLLLSFRRRLHHSGLSGLCMVVALALLLTACAGGASGCGGSTPYDQTPAGTSTINVQVSAAQSTSSTTVAAPDVNTPSFQINLTVQ